MIRALASNNWSPMKSSCRRAAIRCASWDRPFFYISNLNAVSFDLWPGRQCSIIAAGWSVDYASSDPSFIVGIADWLWASRNSDTRPMAARPGRLLQAIPACGAGVCADRRNDRREHAGKHHLGASGRRPALLHAQRRRNLEPDYSSGRFELERVSKGPIISMSDPSPPIACSRIRSICIYPGHGVYETTNGGVSWTQVYSGDITPFDWYNAELESVPGEAGNLFFTGGSQGGAQPDRKTFYAFDQWRSDLDRRSQCAEVSCFGFGAAAPGQSYPAIYIVG